MRLIDADKLNARLSRDATPYFTACDIEAAPTIDAVPVVHGRWIEKVGRAECSVCHDECWADSAMEYNYCPNCGANMRGDTE